MKDLNQLIAEITAQQSQIRAKQLELARGHIKNALKCVELKELIELAHDIYGEQFAQNAIADHFTTQQQARITQ